MHAFQCDKDFVIDEYLKNCTCVKSLVITLAIICDEIMNTPMIVSIESNSKKAVCKPNYWLLCTTLLLVVRLLLLIVIFINCCCYRNNDQ